MGRRSAEDVAQQLLESDIYVHTSRIDNSPNGLCEAMILGLPVVSTNVGGVPSLLEHGRQGILVPPGDPWAMAGAVLQLHGAPDLAAQKGLEARKRALVRHNLPSVARSVLRIYERVLTLSDPDRAD